jgi:hypothetical protein
MKVPGGPDWMASDGRYVFVKLDAAAVLRLDPKTAAVLGRTEIGGPLCQGLGVGFGAVWSCAGSNVVRIDPGTDEVTATIDVDKVGQQGHLVTGFGHVWVLTGDGRTLTGIDPASNTVNATIPLDVRGTELAIDPASVWVLSSDDRAVLRVDAAARAVTGRVAFTEMPATIDAGGGVWVGFDSAIRHIDPQTLVLGPAIAGGPGAEGGIAATGRDVWVRMPGPYLRHVDATSGRLVEDVTGTGDEGSGSVIVTDEGVWTTANDADALHRFPLRRRAA